jgi:hypothetical protein
MLRHGHLTDATERVPPSFSRANKKGATENRRTLDGRNRCLRCQRAYFFLPFLAGWFLITACAAARRAIGTRNGEQLT